jgi:hypothetical protein
LAALSETQPHASPACNTLDGPQPPERALIRITQLRGSPLSPCATGPDDLVSEDPGGFGGQIPSLCHRRGFSLPSRAARMATEGFSAPVQMARKVHIRGSPAVLGLAGVTRADSTPFPALFFTGRALDRTDAPGPRIRPGPERVSIYSRRYSYSSPGVHPPGLLIALRVTSRRARMASESMRPWFRG